MAASIQGLHHITAVSGPAQENYDFYHDKLGLRFIKKTINFDDPFTYHLYYGNYYGTPGSAITFFPWQHVGQGSPNTGEATVVQYAVPKGSRSFWEDRLKEAEIQLEKNYTLFGNPVISLYDNDGMKIELVEAPEADQVETRGEGEIPDRHAIRGFFGTTLSLADTGRTAELLEEFGWKHTGEEMGSTRYASTPDNHLGSVVDLRKEDLNGTFGRGSVHHIAFRVADDEAQAEWREKLLKMGFQVTPVQNRDYFRSVYFREHGGVLFELATDIPGFTKDEPLEELGKQLKIPSWYEKHRDEIEARLPELRT